jgi:dienelactone hydrolase
VGAGPVLLRSEIGGEISQGKLADLRAAVGVLAGRPQADPDRIGLVGVCLGAGHIVMADPESNEFCLD